MLWLVKGDKLNEAFPITEIHDFIESTPPDKIMHDWEQSATEAEYVISKLTVENQVVFDLMLGAWTTGIAALKLKRKFVDIEIDPESFKMAKTRIAASSDFTFELAS